MRWWFTAVILLLTSCSSLDGGLTVQLDAEAGGGPASLDGWEVVARPLVTRPQAVGEVDGSAVIGSTCQQLRRAEPTVADCEETQTTSVAWDLELARAETNGVGLAHLDVDTSDGLYIGLDARPTEADPLCLWTGGERVDPGSNRVIIPILEACE